MQGPVRRHLERKALYTCSSSDSAGLVRVCSAFFRVRFDRVQLNVGRILRPLRPVKFERGQDTPAAPAGEACDCVFYASVCV